MVGWTLSWIVVLSLVSLGFGACVAPRRASAQYGIVLDDVRALAFVRAMGVRDLVIGGLLGLMALDRGREALGWGMGIAALIAAVDLLVVTADQRATVGATGPARAARRLHAAGAVGLVVAAAVLLAGY
jgi:hypothetical protein